MKATGVVTSPNHPNNYTHNLDKTQTIEVESGKILRLEFTHFAVSACDVTTCPCDFVKITDGNGTTLMDNSCGSSTRPPSSPYYFALPIITSKSNRVEIFFHTNARLTWPGWSLSWSAATGEKDLMFNSIGIFIQLNRFTTKLLYLHRNIFRSPIKMWSMMIMGI